MHQDRRTRTRFRSLWERGARGLLTRSRTVATAAALSTLSACAGLLGIEPPDVTLANIQPVQITPFEQRFDITLRLRNVNDTPLVVDGMAVDLTVNDAPFGRGVTDERVALPRLGETTLRVPVAANTIDLMQQFFRFAQRGEVRYGVSGFAYLVLEGGERVKVPFEESGDVLVRQQN